LQHLHGKHLLFLVIFKLVHPEALIRHYIIFLAMNLGEAVVFQKQEISKALKALGYTWKKMSTEAK